MKQKGLKTLIIATCLCLVGCSGGNTSSGSTTEPTSGGDAEYTVGIIQLTTHVALDAATQGFKDVLNEELGDTVKIEYQDAAGDSATCNTIAAQYVSEGVDLIMANATPALQAAASATGDIPILGTSITEYGVALDINDFNGVTGRNVSGTSDLAPLDQQAAMFDELLPEVKSIGILFCSAEPNSVYQSKVVQAALEAAGKTVKEFKFTDSNDVQAVTEAASKEVEAFYIPTDNTAADCAEIINSVALPAGIPIIAGEEGICRACGIATLSIDYYELGRVTGYMAVRILKDNEDVSAMPIEYFTNPVKKYDEDRCMELGVIVGEEYTKIED